MQHRKHKEFLFVAHSLLQCESVLRRSQEEVGNGCQRMAMDVKACSHQPNCFGQQRKYFFGALEDLAESPV